MQVLDSKDIALSNTHLIEASAGTGKTYTITTSGAAPDHGGRRSVD